jgi:hypothetical protein
MRRIAAMLGAAAMVLFVSNTVSAQAPNLSGTWVAEAPAGGAPAGGGGGGAKTLTIKRAAGAQGQAPADIVLMLDGSDSKIMMPGRQGGEPTAMVAKAKVDGNKIVITRTVDMQGTPVTATQTLSLEGGKLTVVTNSGREGATPQTRTYTKK